MELFHFLFAASTFGPAALMLLALASARWSTAATCQLWTGFHTLSAAALVCAVLAAAGLAFGQAAPAGAQAWFTLTPLGAGLAVLVQFLGIVIGRFSARYLQGEPAQRRYVTSLAGVLAAVHLLLLANHWLVLIAAWALVGVALQPLLCFYPDRPFALLAAHKKRLTDRLADAMLAAAAALAWWSVGSGSFTDLAAHLAREGASPALQASAVLLVLAVVLRTALLPVHGWLIQVMEAPTPVSALLHAGVVNLGGYVLIRFAPLLEQAPLARWLLVGFGLGTAVLAGLVMLTRISIKVRLAWSTVAQMGFMVMECGLGLYTLAALHLIGHSLYKAQAFLAASSVVQHTRRQALHGTHRPVAWSLWLAPAWGMAAVLLLQAALSPGAWPWWWSVVLGLAWAPLLWLPVSPVQQVRAWVRGAVSGTAMVAGLTGAALLAHVLPWGLQDAPHHLLGGVATVGLAVLCAFQALLQARPQALQAWHRWSYAGFYLDEYATRLTLWLWPTRWTPDAPRSGPLLRMPVAAAGPSQ